MTSTVDPTADTHATFHVTDFNHDRLATEFPQFRWGAPERSHRRRQVLRRCSHRLPHHSRVARTSKAPRRSSRAPDPAPYERIFRAKSQMISGAEASELHAAPAPKHGGQPCRCGCGEAVAAARKFVDQDHYSKWLSGQRYVGRHARPSS